MKGFIPFPKPTQDIAKCKRWLVACSRDFFSLKYYQEYIQICALHWPGEKGLTAEFPDPRILLHQKQVERVLRRERLQN